MIIQYFANSEEGDMGSTGTGTGRGMREGDQDTPDRGYSDIFGV